MAIAPTPLSSPNQRRSQYLAEALKSMRAEPERIGGYGDLAARLAAQYLTQRASEKTDEAVGVEARNAALARRQALFGGIEGLDVGGEAQPVPSSRLGNPIAGALRMMGGGNRGEQQAPSSPSRPAPEFNVMQGPAAPAGGVQGRPLPQIGMMPQDGGQDPRMGPVAPAPAQAAPMQADPNQIPPEIVQQAQRFLALGTPEGEKEALKLVQGWQQRQAVLASLTPEQLANPNFVYAALNAPGELGGSLAKGFAPMVGAQGSSIITPNTGQRYDVPNYQVVNDTVFRTTGSDIGVAATAPPGYDDVTRRRQADRPEAVNTPTGTDTRLIGPTGEVVDEFAGRTPTVDQGSPMERLAPQERGMITQASTQASQARGRIRDAERFQTLNRERGTGPLVGFVGPILANDPLYAEMRQLESKLTPREREPGSGPMSDRDIVLYNRAIPRLGNPGPTNDAVVTAAVAMSQRDIEYAAFLEEWAMRNGTLLGSTESWQQYVDQNPLLEEQRGGGISLRQEVTPWRTYFGYGDQQQRQSGPASQGGGPVQINTEEEYRRLAPGTPYIAPDGQRRTKQ